MKHGGTGGVWGGTGWGGGEGGGWGGAGGTWWDKVGCGRTQILWVSMAKFAFHASKGGDSLLTPSAHTRDAVLSLAALGSMHAHTSYAYGIGKHACSHLLLTGKHACSHLLRTLPARREALHVQLTTHRENTAQLQQQHARLQVTLHCMLAAHRSLHANVLFTVHMLPLATYSTQLHQRGGHEGHLPRNASATALSEVWCSAEGVEWGGQGRLG